MDEIDKKILISLQEDVSIPLSELSKKVGVSTTPCWSRIKKNKFTNNYFFIYINPK